MKTKFTIKTKLIIVSLILLIVPIFTIGTLTYFKSSSSLDNLGETNLQNSVEMTIEMIDMLNDEVENGNLSLTAAQERVKIAILGEKDTDGNRPINPNIDVGENGYLFILDDQGNEIAHPTLEGENLWDETDSNGRSFVQDMIAIGDAGGFTHYDWPLPGTDVIEGKVTYSKTDPYWGWTINGSTYMLDFNEDANEILRLNFIVTIISILIGVLIIWLFANNVSKPIRKVTNHMNGLANGDLTQDEIQVKSKDETGQLARSMNNLQTELKDIITNISGASEVMASQSEELTQSANEVTAGSEQIATTMDELASGTESQATNASDLSENMGMFITKVEEANVSGKQIQEASQEVIDLTNEGTQLMATSNEQMAIIDKIVHEAVQKVTGLDTHAQEISELVSVIQDIADQTNLLSLNAAIEAARAGEHGQGFAVVADEVRKLAEQSSHSVANITNIVDRIQNESSNVASSLEASYKDVEQGTNQIATTAETFNQISDAVTKMVERIYHISENLLEISVTSKEMNGSIQEIAAISEESAAGVEQTSASTQQTSSAMQEVAAFSNDLAKLAEDLQKVVGRFTLSQVNGQ